MTNEQLHANRNCPYGGGRKDCSCDGNCISSTVIVRADDPRCDCALSRDQCEHPVCTTGIINAARDANQ